MASDKTRLYQSNSDDDENLDPTVTNTVFIDRGVQTLSHFLASEPQTATALAGQPVTRCRSRSHTVTLLCAALFLIWGYSALSYDPWGLTNQLRGCLASLFFFLLFCTLQLPDGILVRPHPAFWRLVKGVSVLYLSLLSFLLFQSVDDVRHWLKLMDHTLGTPVIEKNYGESCDIITWNHPKSVIFNEKFDVFVFAHFFGWMIKALIIRDTKLLWIMSFLFEFMEITFRHVLPNFSECWWDHLLMDIFGCNWLGIIAGMKLVKSFEMKSYHWKWKHRDTSSGSQLNILKQSFSSNSFQPPVTKLQRSSTVLSEYFELLTPSEWTHYKWPCILSSYETYCSMVFFIFGVTFLDLNLFFLKAQLGIEPTHWIIILRTLFFIVAASSGTRDLYEFVTQPNHRRLGLQGWLSVAIILTELLMAIRFWHVLPNTSPMPTPIKIIWIISITSIIGLGGILYFDPQPQRLKPRISRKTTWVRQSCSDIVCSDTIMHSIHAKTSSHIIKRQVYN